MNREALIKARESRGMNRTQVNDMLGWKGRAYFIKERGGVGFTFKDVADLNKVFSFSKDEFVDIFFDGQAPFVD